jgi:transposase-like protein
MGFSYRDLEEIMEERGVNVDHATLNRWVIRYAPTIAAKAPLRFPDFQRLTCMHIRLHFLLYRYGNRNGLCSAQF